MKPKLTPRSTLLEIKRFLDSEGLKIESFKLIAKAYQNSWHRMTGVVFHYGDTTLRIGPSEVNGKPAPEFNEPGTRKLDLMDHNPFAIISLILDWRDSPLRYKGLVFLVDDVLIRIGPLKDPIVIRPERV